jgi:hypothetical protein
MPGVEWDLLSDKVSAPPPVGSLGVYEIANGRTVVRHLHVYVSDNGRSAGGTRGRGHGDWRRVDMGAPWLWRGERRRSLRKEDACYGSE